MTIEEKLKDFIISKYGNLSNFSKEIDMANSTLSTILKKGVRKASITNILKICEALEISADGLAEEKIVPYTFNQKNPSKSTDIDKMLDHIKNNSGEYTFLTVDDKPLTKKELEFITYGFTLVVQLLKKKRKDECE